ncbi:MAG: hypothetical protein K0U24_04065 [Gammaproteobacteria bacterium]|nr:hypothetical protein [Gammaproteobacteria bacterium]MCH9763389.1 hypothetical protein [Gammaproteobacteria bacterium]
MHKKNKQHYYLQSMGITPWILRDKPKAPIVVLFDNLDFNSAERILLDNMFQSVGLDISALSLKCSSEKSSAAKEACIKLPHPSYLLEHPIKKREAYAALGRVAL